MEKIVELVGSDSMSANLKSQRNFQTILGGEKVSILDGDTILISIRTISGNCYGRLFSNGKVFYEFSKKLSHTKEMISEFLLLTVKS